MRLKTTIKLFFQNLGLVWKVAVYKLITYSLTTLLVWLSAMPIVNKLTQEGFFTAFKNIFTIDENLLTNLGGKVAQLTNLFLEIITNNWNTLSVSIIMLIAVVTLFSYFINALADIPTCEVLYGSMSCNAKFSFVSCYIRNFSKSLVYACVKMFSAFIVDTIIFATLFALINLCTLSQVLSWLAPCLAVCAFILLFSFRLVLFSCFAPNIVLNGYNTFKSLAKGVKLGFKHFIDNYATASIVVLIVLSINLFFALFTFGASLFITLPASLILITVFDMVVFYSSSGMYYYVGENNIQDETKGVKRLEQQDTVKDLKNII